jgi:threonylcarbamoyladenosine tRNA methylthiotransferase MtaB
LVIINTCTVTGRAAMQSRQALRQAIRKYPEAKIVVTGCLAQTSAEELNAIEGVDLVVGHFQKTDIPVLVQKIPANARGKVLGSNLPCNYSMAPVASAAPEGRTRVFLKVQDGCNAQCTYCIVPQARGPSRSMPAPEVYRHLRHLGEKGFKEVVLTGIHLGRYGTDLVPLLQLFDLIAPLSSKSPVERIRLSSIEPTEIDPRIIDHMDHPQGVICPHLHIPLQSGADEILKRMGRNYSSEDYRQVIQAIRRRLPFAAIGTDVLVGFPGEDEGAFRQTYDLISELPLTYLHVFPFSPRKGTPAATFKGRIADQVVKDRCRAMRLLGEEKKARFFKSLINQTVQVLIETAQDPIGKGSKGLSANYIPMSISDSNLKPNTLVRARIERVASDLTVWACVC